MRRFVDGLMRQRDLRFEHHWPAGPLSFAPVGMAESEPVRELSRAVAQGVVVAGGEIYISKLVSLDDYNGTE